MVNRAAEYNARVVNLMVTHYWVDANFDGAVDHYCHKIRHVQQQARDACTRARAARSIAC